MIVYKDAKKRIFQYVWFVNTFYKHFLFDKIYYIKTIPKSQRFNKIPNNYNSNA